MRKRPPLPGNLAEQAYVRIREKILRGEFPLGAAISRRGLAVEFGMSFLPISEAIKRLEQDGLVESQPRVGTRVRIPTARDLRDRCIIREALETQSARLFAEKASSDERNELRAMAAHLDSLMNASAGCSNDAEARFQAETYHSSFHMRIAECTGCLALCEALARNQVLIFNWLYDVSTGHHTPPDYHRQLSEALAGTDPDHAEKAMRAHVRYGFEEIQAEIVRRFGAHSAGLESIQRLRTSAPARSGSWRARTNKS